MQDTIQGTAQPTHQESQAPTRVLRRSHDRMIGGVAGGLAEYFDVDPTIVRLGLVFTALVSGGVVLVGYIAMWIIMPEVPASTMPGLASSPHTPMPAQRSSSGAPILGFILVAVGGFALLDQLSMLHVFGWGIARFWWPSLLIAAGLALIVARARD